MIKKALLSFLILVFVAAGLVPLYAGAQMTEYLCEVGIKFYREGRYDEAMAEFKKALILEPNYRPALKYIEMIKVTLGEREEMPAVNEPIQKIRYAAPAEKTGPQKKYPPVITGPAVRIPQIPEKKEAAEISFPPEKIIIPAAKEIPSAKTKQASLKEILDLVEIQKEMINYQKARRKMMFAPPLGLTSPAGPPAAKPLSPRIIILNETAYPAPQQVEVEQGQEIVILGKNISRFLITEPAVIWAEKRTPDEVAVTGKNIGYADVIIWDDNGRWPQTFLVIFPKPEAPAYEEIQRREAESMRNFKLRYSVDWLSFESGKRIHSWRRSSYSWLHGLSLTGPTPYGDFDATTSIRAQNSSSRADMNYLTVGLTNGNYENFKGFQVRAFDFAPPFSDLAFPGATLRGGMFNSPAFNKKLAYSAFWGREGGGRYGGLSPDLTKTLHSFLEGFNLSLYPDKIQTYKFSVVHGWGRDRTEYLRPYDYDLSGKWNFDRWGLGYEIANDTDSFAHVVNTNFKGNKLTNLLQFRDVDKKFMSITGTGWRQGEIGGLLNTTYQLAENLNLRSNIDVYKDRLFPAPENPKRLNEDVDLGASLSVNPSTTVGLNYAFHNDLGRISQSRYESTGLTLNKRIHLLRDIFTYANYYHQKSTSYSSHASDYINERINSGLRLNLLGRWYYYLNSEFNWLQERYYATWGHPKSWENGLDWNGQLGDSSLFGNFRLSYHDEEDTTSNLSFLSGEDYLEGYSELSYRPRNDLEIYGSGRVRNVWADNPNINQHIEGTFNAGMRYLWDTGFRFEAKGDIEGYVFKDLNSDGLRQRDEPPVEGIRLWLGKDKSCVTDLFGYYKFKGVKGRKAFINLDTSTIPSGYVLTIPAAQEAAILHKRAIRIDFGIASRTEINGIIFEDSDENGEFNRGDKGIGGILLTLEGGQKSRTDALGRYSFNNISVGEHTITLDLSTIPVYYLPEQALKQSVSVAEGDIVTRHIPLRRIKE